jgi:hypothetical protein
MQNDQLIKQKLDEIDRLLLEVKNLKPIKDVKRVLASEKRRATILKKRQAKADKKEANEKKFTDQFPDVFGKIKDEKNKPTYIKVMKDLKKKFKSEIHMFNTGARYKGRDVLGLTINQRMNKNEILETANHLSHMLGAFDNEGLIDLSVRGDRWYYQGQNTWGSDIEFLDDYGDELNNRVFDKMAIYISALPQKKGGYSANNDCLYSCLHEILGNKLFKIFPKPNDLKKLLQLEYNAKVCISSMELLEKKLNCSINVSGDYTYTTKLQSNKIINLQLINEHYVLINKKKDIFNVNMKRSRRDRKVMMFDKATFTGYDGSNVIAFTNEYKKLIYSWHTDYILVNIIDKQKTIQENYDMFMDMATELKVKTNGRINLFKTGGFQNTALDLFNEMTKHIINPDNIEQVESEFINKASQGAIIFTTKGYEGKAYKSDVKSMYPSILKSSQLFPVRAGELQYLKELPSIIYNGIYRCKITGRSRLFRFNKDNYYTSIDLNRARDLGLHIDLIIDDQPNFLYYSRDKCLTGSEIFSEYVNYLFPLKDQKVNGVKFILNILWGSLCQKDENKYIHKHNDSYDIPDDVKVTFRPYNDDNTIISTIKYSKYYKYGWARIMPFLIAKGRSVISKIMEPFDDIIIRCHTDGIMFKEEPKGIKYGSDIGDLVDEGYLEHIIIDQSGKINIL